MTDELRREPVGVVGRELREELAFRSSELRLSEPSLKPLLMELLSSQLQREKERERDFMSLSIFLMTSSISIVE